jgi:methylmalonyl-CoA/ethylmalonyl-CoA epimerase
MTILGIDHVGVAVTEAEAASQTFRRLLGLGGTDVEEVGGAGVQVCFIPERVPNLEVLAPAGAAEDSTVGRFLARRGEGLHHVCFAVDDVRAELGRQAAAGIELIDNEPRRGHGGWVAFVHPRSAHGVLVELLERDA